MIACSLVLAVTLAQAAPNAAAQSAPASSGVALPWDVKKLVEEVQAPVNRMDTVLGRLQPQTWNTPGASSYAAQVDTAHRTIAVIRDNLSAVSRQPDKLSAVLRAYLSLQQVEGTLDSLASGAAQFQNLASSHEIQDATNALLNQREKIVRYMLDLSEFMESSQRASQTELESCREQLFQRATKKGSARPKR